MYSGTENEPFLGEEEKNTFANFERPRKLPEWWNAFSTIKKSLVCLLALAVYTFLTSCSTIAIFGKAPPSNNALREPNIRYHTNKTITAGMSPFAGGPGEDLEDAWHDLMSSISIRVSQEELNHNGNHQESIALPESGGHLAWLGVFHQLHCLKMIRKMNYRDYYYPNQTETEKRDMEVHINHCIENLRQTVMCNPDTSFTTFVWTHSDPKPVLDVRRFERQCVDWDYFMEGVKPRVVSFEEVDRLVNPVLNKTV